MVAGNFDADLSESEGNPQDKEITATFATAGLEDFGTHFLQWCKLWVRYGRTWSILRGGKEVQSQTDYLLGMDRCLFHKLYVWCDCHNTYH